MSILDFFFDLSILDLDVKGIGKQSAVCKLMSKTGIWNNFFGSTTTSQITPLFSLPFHPAGRRPASAALHYPLRRRPTAASPRWRASSPPRPRHQWEQPVHRPGATPLIRRGGLRIDGSSAPSPHPLLRRRTLEMIKKQGGTKTIW
jgi:hypothetical protein